MRELLSALILILALQSWTKADDVTKFEIEGISIGDSLLNFFSEQEIKNNTLPANYPKNNYMRRAYFKLENKIFEAIEIHYKTNDKKFIIYGILGSLFFKNFDNCYKKSKEISEDLKKLFPDIEVDIYEKKHAADKTGKSTNKGYIYWLTDQSFINVACYDWSPEMRFKDHLRLSIVGKEFQEFLRLNYN